MFIDRVDPSADLSRILRLPRRSWSQDTASKLSDILTPLLGMPGNRMRLRPIQAQAMADIGTQGGGILSVGVGHGKTLISLLTPYVLESRQALLLVPASLVEKTRNDMDFLADQWRIDVEAIHVCSYEQLSSPKDPTFIDKLSPDLIIADECHRLRNHRAACTKRVSRYMKVNLGTRFVAMSGTLIKSSLRDYAHFARWALGESAPVPFAWPAIEAWASCLDNNPKGFDMTHPGALLAFLKDADENAFEDQKSLVRAVRVAVQRFQAATPGFLATEDSFDDSVLVFATPRLTPPVEVTTALTHLLEFWEKPDGTPIPDGMQLKAATLELSQGFYYTQVCGNELRKWAKDKDINEDDIYSGFLPGALRFQFDEFVRSVKRAPAEWLMARKLWYSRLRALLKPNRAGLDSEFLVTNAVLDRRIGNQEDRDALGDWIVVCKTFTPVSVPVWISDHAIERARSWVTEVPPGIVWTPHRAFGLRLSRETFLPFFQQKGTSPCGKKIYDHNTPEGTWDGPFIASIASNGTGRNLQAYHRNYVASPPAGGDTWEQLIGRTHRPGQTGSTVSFQLPIWGDSDDDTFTKAVNSSHFIQDSTGQKQKLASFFLPVIKKDDTLF